MTTATKTILIVIAGVVLAGIAFAVGHWTGHVHAGHEYAAVHDGHDHGEAGEQWYTCSMHPQVRTTDPREKCPICGMDLIPVPDDGDDGDPTLPRLSLSPRAKALMQVQTWPVERRDVTRPVRLFGRVAFDEQRIRRVSAWVDGRLDELYVDYCCAEVEQGERMFLMYSPTLIAAQEELLQALRAEAMTPAVSPRERVRSRAVAARDRLRLLGLSAEQIERIEREGVQDRLEILAPVSGTVIEWFTREGMYVQTGDPLYTVVDLSRVWINLEAYESDLPWLREGQEAAFTVAALPGEEFRGQVSFIERELEDDRRTVRVRVEVPNEDRRLKPGMFATGAVQARLPGNQTQPSLGHGHDGVHENNTRGVLVIPASAPLITGQRAVVYVQDPDPELERPTFEGRHITLGPRAGDWYVVREGLSEGELVVTNGNFKIDSELQIRGRPSMMAPAGNGAPVHDHAGHAHQPVQDRAGHAAVTPAPTPAPAATGPQRRLEAPAAFQAGLGQVVVANFELVRTLSDDDPAASRVAVNQVRQALAAVDISVVEGAARDAWRVLAGRMSAALDELAGAEDLDEMRRHFEPFSDELTRAVRTYGVSETGPVYRAMCPMVNDRRAYWLQPQRPITNPYWGEAMYACGEIVETIVE